MGLEKAGDDINTNSNGNGLTTINKCLSICLAADDCQKPLLSSAAGGNIGDILLAASGTATSKTRPVITHAEHDEMTPIDRRVKGNLRSPLTADWTILALRPSTVT